MLIYPVIRQMTLIEAHQDVYHYTMPGDQCKTPVRNIGFWHGAAYKINYIAEAILSEPITLKPEYLKHN